MASNKPIFEFSCEFFKVFSKSTLPNWRLSLTESKKKLNFSPLNEQLFYFSREFTRVLRKVYFDVFKITKRYQYFDNSVSVHCLIYNFKTGASSISWATSLLRSDRGADART